MKTILLSFLCFLFFFMLQTKGISQNYVWAKNTGSVSSGPTFFPALTTSSMAVDANGNVFTSGELNGTADFDPGPGVFNMTNGGGDENVYIQKLDAAGNLLWAKLIHSFGNNRSHALCLDNSNNVYVVGIFFNAASDFDPGVGVTSISPNGVGAYILKLNTLGNFVWVKTLGNANWTQANSITADNNDDLIIGGTFFGIHDFDPGFGVQNLDALSAKAQYILKLNSTGNFIWVKNAGAVGSDGLPASIDVDANNNIYCGGNFEGIVDLDPGTSISNFICTSGSPTSTNSYVLKLNASGNYIYGRSVQGDFSRINSLKVDNNNNVVIAGVFQDQIDFNPGGAIYSLTAITPVGSPANRNGFIVKLNNAGNFLWAKQFGGGYVELEAMDIDAVGNIYTTGSFYNTVDFNPGVGIANRTVPGAQVYNGFYSKLNVNGDYVTVTQFSSFIAEGFAIALDDNYNIYSIGRYDGAVDFDPSSGVNSLTSFGGEPTLYCYKWNQCQPTASTINATGCTYTLNGQTYNGNGIYTQVLTNSAGCDSILTLVLTGSASNTSITPLVCNGTYTLNGQTYNVTGTYTQSYTNALGCDSNTTIYLTIGNTTFSTINATECDAYYFNSVSYTTSGIYVDTILNSTGCDSVVTLNVTINPSYNISLNVNTCAPYTFNGITYTTSGFYFGNFMSSSGCDSMVTLNLVIAPLPNTNVTQNSCGPYTFNGQTYNTSGIYTQTLVTSLGCDSVVVINLTINNLPNVSITQSGTILVAGASAPATYQWIKCSPYSVIAGATSQSYVAIANGSYAVIVTQNGCTDTSVCKTVTGVGIIDYALTNMTKLYPNPTEDMLYIEFEKQINNVTVKILSLTHQVLFTNQFSPSNKIKIPVSNFAAGMYMVHISDADHNATFKFVKK